MSKNCKFNYLKPLSYDDLFDDNSKNKCSNYQLVLEKLSDARTAFFSFQSGIFNFIKDCSRLQQKIRPDISGNDLDSLKYEYTVLLNNLIANIAISLRKKMDSDNFILINFEVPQIYPNKTIEDMQTLLFTNIIYSDEHNNIDTLITSIPSVCLYLCDNYQLQIKIVSPKAISYSNLSFEKTYVKSFKCKQNDIFIKNMTPALEDISNNQDDYGFTSNENAYQILDEIINYESGLSNTIELADVIERLDGIILSIENTHRTVIQKIKTEQLVYKQSLDKKDNKKKCKKKVKKLVETSDSDDSEDCSC